MARSGGHSRWRRSELSDKRLTRVPPSPRSMAARACDTQGKPFVDLRFYLLGDFKKPQHVGVKFLALRDDVGGVFACGLNGVSPTSILPPGWTSSALHPGCKSSTRGGRNKPVVWACM
eukprot:1369884-Rhodomonas_salina.5